MTKFVTNGFDGFGLRICSNDTLTYFTVDLDAYRVIRAIRDMLFAGMRGVHFVGT